MAKRKPRTPRPPKRNRPPEKSGEIQVSGRERTQFKPGQSGNPKGKPKGTRHGLKALIEAMEAEGVDIVALAIQRAKKSNSVLIKLLDKLVPCAKSIEIRDESSGARKVIFEEVKQDDVGDGGN